MSFSGHGSHPACHGRLKQIHTSKFPASNEFIWLIIHKKSLLLNQESSESNDYLGIVDENPPRETC